MSRLEIAKVSNSDIIKLINAKAGTNFDIGNPMTLTNSQLEDLWGVLVDKYISVKVFNTLDWDNPYDIFFRDKGQFAGILEMLSSDIFPSKPYDENESPYAVEKHDPKKAHFILNELRRWKSSVSVSRIRRAFNNEFDLHALLDLQVLKIEDSWRYENYVNVTEDLSGINIYETIGELDLTSKSSMTFSTKKVYNTLQNLVSKLAKPSRLYNSSGNMGASKKGKMIIIVRHEYQNIFDLEIMASLFHSSKIALPQYFRKIITDIDMPNENTIGYVLDENAYMQCPHIKEQETKQGNLLMHQTLFYQDLRALVPFLNAVKLVKRDLNGVVSGTDNMLQKDFDKIETKKTITKMKAELKAIHKDNNVEVESV